MALNSSVEVYHERCLLMQTHVRDSNEYGWDCNAWINWGRMINSWHVRITNCTISASYIPAELTSSTLRQVSYCYRRALSQRCTTQSSSIVFNTLLVRALRERICDHASSHFKYNLRSFHLGDDSWLFELWPLSIDERISDVCPTLSSYWQKNNSH